MQNQFHLHVNRVGSVTCGKILFKQAQACEALLEYTGVQS